MFRILAFVSALCAAGCSSVQPSPGPKKPVWLVGSGIHSAFVFRAQDTPGEWRQRHGTPHPDYLLIGWGHGIFYPGAKVNALSVARGLLPARAAIHVMPVRGPITRRFTHSDLVRFDVSDDRHAALCAYVEDAFARGADGNLVYLKPGYFAGGRFYRARTWFFFPYICHTWTGRGLRVAGVPIFLPTAVIAGNLFYQARRNGIDEGRKRAPRDDF